MGDGLNRLDDKSSAWADRKAGELADSPKKTIAKWFFGLVGIVILLVLFFQIIGFISLWGGAAKQIVSPQNVNTQYTNIIDDWQGLQAAASNVCDVQNTPSNSSSPTLIENPAFAYKAKYRQIQVDYNRRQNNLFEGKLVGPKGYPRIAPTLKQMERKVC